MLRTGTTNSHENTLNMLAGSNIQTHETHEKKCMKHEETRMQPML
jgi:hypothetical protein